MQIGVKLAHGKTVTLGGHLSRLVLGTIAKLIWGVAQ